MGTRRPRDQEGNLDQSLEATVGELLREQGLRLAVAESCTGGLLGHRITNVAGSSAYFLGGITSYAYEAKVGLLGVQWETLERYGAVSRETALEMAQGARLALAADISVSITGIAGPGGGMPEKPVGLTWIALSAPAFLEARSFVWPGNRLDIKEQSTEAALAWLISYLRSLKDGSHLSNSQV